jgi:hypothetical protein
MAPPEMVDPNDLIAINREARRRAVEEGRASLEESSSPSQPHGSRRIRARCSTL